MTPELSTNIPQEKAVDSNSSRIIDKLVPHFVSKMKSPKVPLLRDFKTYAASLPVREFGSEQRHLRLYDYPFIVRDADLDLMARMIRINCLFLRDIS